jgi:ABC-2 type transport system permease protein
MAGQLIRLKLRVLWNTMTRQVSTTVGIVLGLLWGLGVVAGMAAGAIAGMAAGSAGTTGALMVVAGALLVVGWVVVPVLFASIDNTLDPRRFAPHVAPTARLALALVLATGVGVGGALSTLGALIPVAAWAAAGDAGAALAALAGAPLGLLAAFTWARVGTTWLGVRLTSTSSRRDLLNIVAFALFMGVVTPMGLWMRALGSELSSSAVTRVGRMVAWTPMGAPWGMALSAHEGQWGQVAAQALIALAACGIGLALWLRVLPSAMSGVARRLPPRVDEAVAAGRSLIDPDLDRAGRRQGGRDALVDSRPRAGGGGGHGERWLPGVERWQKLGLSAPSASLAQRTSVYWLKDPRLSTSLASGLLFPVLAVVMSRAARADGSGSGASGLFLLFFEPVVLGGIVGALMQYDSTAAWLPIASGMRGSQERLGRLAGSLPLILAVTVGSAALAGVLIGLPGRETLLLSAAMVVLLAAACAISLFVGAGWVYPVQPPGTSPMSTKGTGQMMVTLLIQFLVWIGGMIAAAPALVLLGFAQWSGSVPAAIAVPGAAVWTVVVLWAGVVSAGRLWDARCVEDLTAIRSWPGH